jgi:hypothetical protein
MPIPIGQYCSVDIDAFFVSFMMWTPLPPKHASLPPANPLQQANPAPTQGLGLGANPPQPPTSGASGAISMAKSRSAAHAFRQTQERQNDKDPTTTTVPQHPTPEALEHYFKTQALTKLMPLTDIATFFVPGSQSGESGECHSAYSDIEVCKLICSQIDTLSDQVVEAMGSQHISDGLYGADYIQMYAVSVLHKWKSAGQIDQLSSGECGGIIAAYTKAALLPQHQDNPKAQRCLELAIDSALKMDRSTYNRLVNRMVAFSQNMPLLPYLRKACEKRAMSSTRQKKQINRVKYVARVYQTQTLAASALDEAQEGSAVALLVSEISIDGRVDGKKRKKLLEYKSWGAISYIPETINRLSEALELQRECLDPGSVGLDQPRHDLSRADLNGAAQLTTRWLCIRPTGTQVQPSSQAKAGAQVSAAPQVGNKRSLSAAFGETLEGDKEVSPGVESPDSPKTRANASAALPLPNTAIGALSQELKEPEGVEVFPGMFYKWPD